MLMPILSVTAIGFVAGLIFIVARKTNPLRTLLVGLLGAWLGFALGGLCGVLLDVLARTGSYLPLFGHLAAAVGAVVALLRIKAA